MKQQTLLRELLAGVILVLMVVTNPSMADFETYIRGQLVQEARASGNGALVDIASALKNTTGLDAAGFIARQVISDVVRRNYVVLSTYEGRAGGWIGIGGFFVRVR